MRAVTVFGAGDLRVVEVEDPAAGPGEVLVAMEWGGICGSDLSYWRHGATGTAVLREPLVLGHEVAGRVAALGEGVSDLELGAPVTIHPASLPDGADGAVGCAPPGLEGRENLHPRIRYLGSAATLPHEAGGFSGLRAVRREQVRVLPEGVCTRHGAVAEPLGVAMHAVNRAGGDLAGRRVLVNGAGPIGCLVVAAARMAGAREVVAADIASPALAVARAMGAQAVVDRSAGQGLPEDVDIAFEATGVPGTLGDVLAATRRGGQVIQVGNLPVGEVTAALGGIVTREIDYRGSYRFVDEITDAVAAMAAGLDVEPLLTHSFDVEEAPAAFAVAADRSTGSSKVMLRLG